MKARTIVGSLIVAVMLSALLYAALAAATDVSAVARELKDFPVSVALAMLALSLMNFVSRGLRWRWMCVRSGYSLPWHEGVWMQISGQTMTFTPGRVGELFKAWLTSAYAEMPMATGVALIFAERIADLIAVCVLSVGGVSLIGGSQLSVLALVAAVSTMTLVVRSRWFSRTAIGALRRNRWLSRHEESLERASEALSGALRWRQLAPSGLVSIFAWGVEGIGFALCLQALGFESLSVLGAVSVYAVSTLLGALTFMPGGIGVTEASMAGMLIALGMDPAQASVATLLLRAATLWWAVALGWIALASRPAILRSAFRGEPESA